NLYKPMLETLQGVVGSRRCSVQPALLGQQPRHQLFLGGLGQTLHPPFRLQCSRARAHLLLEDQLKRPLAAQAFGALGRAGPMLVQTPRHVGGDAGVELARPETDEVEKPVIHSEESTGTTWAINGGS